MNVGGRNCVHGFDWSVWQAPKPLAGSGQAFAVFKATEGDRTGYGEIADRRYGQHVAFADEADIPHGAYHFARPDITTHGPAYADGADEARKFLGRVATTASFVVLDLELTEVDPWATAAYACGFWDQVCVSSRFRLREQRLTYVGRWFAWQHAVAVSSRTCLWLPAYTAPSRVNPDPTMIPLPAWSHDLWPEGWCVWQYASNGTVAGTHPSDVNVATVEWHNAIVDPDAKAEEWLDMTTRDEVKQVMTEALNETVGSWEWDTRIEVVHEIRQLLAPLYAAQGLELPPEANFLD